MAIPKNITKEHIENAINEIVPSAIPKERLSDNYLLVYRDKNLPPKYVISIANKFANNKLLDSESFNAVEAKAFLLKRGYNIIEKGMEYYDQLMQFLAQAKTEELTTSKYQKSFSDLKVKVSFGQGNQAKIPWIAFLNNLDSVQEGIYPVYLYYKDQNLLILAYGVSETNKSSRFWNITNSKTIAKYFSENNLGDPQRYGSSYIFKSYDLSKALIEKEMNRDLNELLTIYKANGDSTSEAPTEMFNYTAFYQKTKDAGLNFNEKIISRFVASLCTKPFIICSGLSGSGKTKLAQSFVKWICKNEDQYKIVPVGADWTNREPLLGFPDGLTSAKYVFPDSGVLQLIINACKPENKNKPYFLILDEMNLSHVERYFADFLSIMESQDNIKLYSGAERKGPDETKINTEISWPKNLFIIGTVNIDETTNMFSPKVLDRANTIEFRVTQDEMKNFLNNIKDINMEALAGKGAGMAKSYLEMAANKSFVTSDIEKINTVLVQFFGELKKTGAEFGYRSATEILRLIHQLTELDSKLTTNEKIDIAIIQKLLPKLHGSRRKLCPVLEILGSFCVSGDVKIIKDVFEKADFDFNGATVLYPLSLEKIARMYKGAIDNGFASFAEA